MPGAPIETERLVLRLPVLADASAIERIASDPRVALKTATVPHPYPTGGGRAFVESIDPGAEPMRTQRAIFVRDTGDLVGMVGSRSGVDDGRLEIGYWIDPLSWRRGYATEAADALARYLFAATLINAIEARTMISNPGSQRVLAKAGFVMNREEDMDLPARGGNHRILVWRLDRGRLQGVAGG